MRKAQLLLLLGRIASRGPLPSPASRFAKVGEGSAGRQQRGKMAMQTQLQIRQVGDLARPAAPSPAQLQTGRVPRTAP